MMSVGTLTAAQSMRTSNNRRFVIEMATRQFVGAIWRAEKCSKKKFPKIKKVCKNKSFVGTGRIIRAADFGNRAGLRAKIALSFLICGALVVVPYLFSQAGPL